MITFKITIFHDFFVLLLSLFIFLPIVFVLKEEEKDILK